MNINNTRYDSTSIALHWLFAIGIISTFALGFYMTDLSLSPTKLKLYSWHKWAGISLLAVAILRLVWRVTHQAPKLPKSMSPLMRFLANAMHRVLYFFMIAIPLSGWLMSSASGFQTVWFGILPLPDLVAKDEGLAEILLTAHVVLNYAFLTALLVHIAAAVKHHFIDKDTVLSRMLPIVKPQNTGKY